MTSTRTSQLFLGYGRKGHGVTAHYADAIPTTDVRTKLFGWNAVEVAVYADFGDRKLEIPGKKALVRDDLGIVLGVPSEKYAVHQYNDSLVSGVEKIIGGDLAISAAGYTGNGAKAWISVSLRDTVTTAEGVEFLPFLNAIGSHDSTISTSYKRSVLNMVCNNMIGQLRREKTNTVKVRHTVHSALHLETAQQALAILAQTEDDFSRQVRELCEQEVTATEWAKFVETYVPLAEDAQPGRSRTLVENKREGLHSLYRSDERVAPWAGTAWGVLQAVNTYDHHFATVKGAERAERNQERALTDYYDDLDSKTIATLNRVLVGA